MADDFASRVEGIGALAEPARRALYLYVAAQPHPVSRDQAAAGVGMARHTVKFHLDKLVDEGLLSTEFRRLTGRQGPGAGRPAKLYRRSDRQVSVTLPERRYEQAGHILASALEATQDAPAVRSALERAASAAGRSMAEESPVRRGKSGDSLDQAAEVLAARGYEPRREDDTLVLANCPFHELAREHTQIVCGMNLDVISAALDALGDDDVEAHLDPEPGRCCVTLSLTGARGARHGRDLAKR